MRAIIRGLRASKSVAERQSTMGNIIKTDGPAPASILGLRIVNPTRVNAAIE